MRLALTLRRFRTRISGASQMQIHKILIPIPRRRHVPRTSPAGYCPGSGYPDAVEWAFSQWWNSRPQELLSAARTRPRPSKGYQNRSWYNTLAM